MPSLPEGLLIELVTPLTPTGALDSRGLSRLVQHVAPWAAALVAGTPGVGEALALPPSLRRELFAALLDLKPPHLPLLFGITGGSPTETHDLVRHLEQAAGRTAAGVNIYWLDLSLWWHSNRGLPQALAELGRGLQHSLVLMNHPRLLRRKAQPWKHVNLRTAVLKKLAAVPQITGLIYHGDMRRFLHYYAAVAGRPEFMLYEADEQRFLTRPGARGLVSAGAQLAPQAWQEVVHAYLFSSQPNSQGTSSRLWAQSQLLLSLRELYQLQPASVLKQGLHQLGILSYPTLWPSTPAAPAHAAGRCGQVLARLQEQA
ncbi:MAG: dihydrodipicolinate synthase family protein [Desulfobacca sp.]|uniref:dihydrodipicolinate synthase family protein n=1 Tax=Desulfobacca sp. TaxID=2067990 RepID=UPI004048EB17